MGQHEACLVAVLDRESPGYRRQLAQAGGEGPSRARTHILAQAPLAAGHGGSAMLCVRGTAVPGTRRVRSVRTGPVYFNQDDFLKNWKGRSGIYLDTGTITAPTALPWVTHKRGGKFMVLYRSPLL